MSVSRLGELLDMVLETVSDNSLKKEIEQEFSKVEDEFFVLENLNEELQDTLEQYGQHIEHLKERRRNGF